MRLHIIYIAFITLVALVSCSSSSSKSDSNGNSTPIQAQASEVPIFDVDSAMMFLTRQVSFGPRLPGTVPHEQCAEWLATTLVGMGANVDNSVAHIPHPVTGQDIVIKNVFGQFNPQAADRVLLLAHYDTRPWADEDPDAANHNKPIDGANDGASGVAVILEVARHAASLSAEKGLDVLFVDWEDSGSSGDDDSWCIGSSYFARHLPYSASDAPRYAVLLDMVGGSDAKFPREYFSEIYASDINNIIWNAARTTGYADRFPNSIGGAINDDHLPLLKAGIPAVDIIETRADGFNPTWHTLQDNVANIDPATLEAVGTVLNHIIYSKK